MGAQNALIAAIDKFNQSNKQQDDIKKFQEAIGNARSIIGKDDTMVQQAQNLLVPSNYYRRWVTRSNHLVEVNRYLGDPYTRVALQHMCRRWYRLIVQRDNHIPRARLVQLCTSCADSFRRWDRRDFRDRRNPGVVNYADQNPIAILAQRAALPEEFLHFDHDSITACMNRFQREKAANGCVRILLLKEEMPRSLDFAIEVDSRVNWIRASWNRNGFIDFRNLTWPCVGRRIDRIDMSGKGTYKYHGLMLILYNHLLKPLKAGFAPAFDGSKRTVHSLQGIMASNRHGIMADNLSRRIRYGSGIQVDRVPVDFIAHRLNRNGRELFLGTRMSGARGGISFEYQTCDLELRFRPRVVEKFTCCGFDTCALVKIGSGVCVFLSIGSVVIYLHPLTGFIFLCLAGIGILSSFCCLACCLPEPSDRCAEWIRGRECPCPACGLAARNARIRYTTCLAGVTVLVPGLIGLLVLLFMTTPLIGFILLCLAGIGIFFSACLKPDGRELTVICSAGWIRHT